MTWTERTGDAETGLLVATTFASLIFQRGQLAEARGWLTRLLALDADVPTAVRARAVLHLGFCALFQRDSDAAEHAANEVIHLAATQPWIHSNALNLLGCAVWDRGLLAEARKHMEDGLAIARSQPNADDLMPWILNNLGLLAQQQGNHQEARQAYEAALKAVRNLGVSFGHAIFVSNLGALAWEEGDQQRAAKLMVEALDLAKTVRNAFVAAETLEEVVNHVVAAGRPHVAARLLGAAEGLRQRVGVPVDPAFVAAHETLVQQVRELLGEAVTEQAWAEGKSLSLDQAVSSAMDVMAEVMSQPTSVSDHPSN
jgi:tetratricopeptide (TPR) repeat protein